VLVGLGVVREHGHDASRAPLHLGDAVQRLAAWRVMVVLW
jgi:hypothetical protein